MMDFKRKPPSGESESEEKGVADLQQENVQFDIPDPDADLSDKQKAAVVSFYTLCAPN